MVASEVKNLATQTARATEEIAGQVRAIQESTDSSAQAIHAIGQTINRVSEISTAIASAVEEQGAATQEISRNVQQAAGRHHRGLDQHHRRHPGLAADQRRLHPGAGGRQRTRPERRHAAAAGRRLSARNPRRLSDVQIAAVVVPKVLQQAARGICTGQRLLQRPPEEVALRPSMPSWP